VCIYAYSFETCIEVALARQFNINATFNMSVQVIEFQCYFKTSTEIEKSVKIKEFLKTEKMHPIVKNHQVNSCESCGVLAPARVMTPTTITTGDLGLGHARAQQPRQSA
jgi:hypothetical protein